MPSRQVLSALAGAIATAEAAFGPAWSTGPVASGSNIIESSATLTLPALSSTNKGDLSLWVGMGTSKGDLIQSIAETYQDGAWAVYAYTLLETSPDSQEPVQSAETAASPGDKITMHYVYDSSTQNYTQYVSLNGVQVQTLTTSDGDALGYGSAVECADTSCGTVPSHTWTDVFVKISPADPTYIEDTFGESSGVTGTFTTDDGGATWTCAEFVIPEFTFTD